jgi:hypothetical protein
LPDKKTAAACHTGQQVCYNHPLSFFPLNDRTPSMRKITFLPLAAAGALALLTALPVCAQAPAKKEPPKLEKLEEPEPPTVTIRQPSGQAEITEKRDAGGEVKEVEVKSGPSKYKLKPKQGSGNHPSDDVAVPQWTVKEWGDGPKQKDQDPVTPQTLEPAPAKPAAAPATK